MKQFYLLVLKCKHRLILAAMFIFLSAALHAQYAISFTNKTLQATRKSKDVSVIRVAFTVKSDAPLPALTVELKPNLEKSTIPADAYKVFSLAYPISSLKLHPDSNLVFVELNPDSVPDRGRKLVLDLVIKKAGVAEPAANNKGDNSSMEINIGPIEAKDSTIKSYRYLAYIGTNFDMVDGIKPKNLFFASNIFLHPTLPVSKKKIGAGVYLSLYGNRTMSITDSSGIVRRETRIAGINDSTIRRYSEQQKLIRTRVSDNIGAYISPLFELWPHTKSTLRLFYAPSLEFVWRRTETNSEFTSSANKDSIDERGSMVGAIDLANKIVVRRNEYAFNAGILGLMLVHENKDISMRVHCSVGYSSNYIPVDNPKGFNDSENYERQHDIFFSGRAWITEPITAITLQAEITNGLKHSRPYYGVTLSKAFYLDKLGGFFSPLTKR